MLELVFWCLIFSELDEIPQIVKKRKNSFSAILLALMILPFNASLRVNYIGIECLASLLIYYSSFEVVAATLQVPIISSINLFASTFTIQTNDGSPCSLFWAILARFKCWPFLCNLQNAKCKLFPLIRTLKEKRILLRRGDLGLTDSQIRLL